MDHQKDSVTRTNWLALQSGTWRLYFHREQFMTTPPNCIATCFWFSHTFRSITFTLLTFRYECMCIWFLLSWHCKVKHVSYERSIIIIVQFSSRKLYWGRVTDQRRAKSNAPPYTLLPIIRVYYLHQRKCPGWDWMLLFCVVLHTICAEGY